MDGVGEKQTGVGNYCYMWGFTDWTEPLTTRSSRISKPSPVSMLYWYTRAGLKS